MAANVQIERLTPLDVLMPRIYVVVTLTFRTTETTGTIAQRLQPGLDRLAKQFPWLGGRVVLTPSGEDKPPTPEIRWTVGGASPTLVDKGTVETKYETASAKGMPLSALPTDTWPTAGMVDSSEPTVGAPVMAASLFRFADGQGIGLCVCVHHYAVDATGLGEIIRLWAQYLAGTGPALRGSSTNRLERLENALAPSLSAISSRSLDDILAVHPEYSRTPPAMPSEFPACTFKLFKIPISRLTARKNQLKDYMVSPPTTNTVLCALMWSTITAARTQRDTALTKVTSQLTLAANTRRYIAPDFSDSQDPFLGNAVLVAHSALPVSELTSISTPAGFAAVCEAIGASTRRIDALYVAEVYSLSERSCDYRTIYAGWDLFGARDLTITSWASLDLYETDFGAGLGRPEYVRVPPSEIDSICGVLPRRKGASAADEVLEVIVTLREEDMRALEAGEVWRELAEEV